MDIGSFLSSAFGGGLFGLLGNVAGKVIGLVESRQAFAQKKEEWTHDERLLDLQMKAKAAEAGQALAVAASTGSWSGLAESLKAETGIGPAYAWVNTVRALVRPVLTLGLGGFLCAAFFTLPQGDATRTEMSNSLIFAAVTALTWWFGDRAVKKGS